MTLAERDFSTQVNVWRELRGVELLNQLCVLFLDRGAADFQRRREFPAFDAELAVQKCNFANFLERREITGAALDLRHRQIAYFGSFKQFSKRAEFNVV